MLDICCSKVCSFSCCACRPCVRSSAPTFPSSSALADAKEARRLSILSFVLAIAACWALIFSSAEARRPSNEVSCSLPLCSTASTRAVSNSSDCFLASSILMLCSCCSRACSWARALIFSPSSFMLPSSPASSSSMFFSFRLCKFAMSSSRCDSFAASSSRELLTFSSSCCREEISPSCLPPRPLSSSIASSRCRDIPCSPVALLSCCVSNLVLSSFSSSRICCSCNCAARLSSPRTTSILL
mmetsp:Transcript_18103/g.59469  ORF Transcript_18103/g.59469 Transcript_18103/m.59469 type:complete len:242 (-) Transcript_18103:3367-4092(-)